MYLTGKRNTFGDLFGAAACSKTVLGWDFHIEFLKQHEKSLWSHKEQRGANRTRATPSYTAKEKFPKGTLIENCGT